MYRVVADGLPALVRGLRDADEDGKTYLRRLSAIHRKAARLVADDADNAAPTRAKRSIRGSGSQRAATVRIRARRGDELAVFMGQKRRSGWFAAPRYRGATGRQFRPWIGQDWDPGDLYEIGPAMERSLDRVEEIYLDELEGLLTDAFPD